MKKRVLTPPTPPAPQVSGHGLCPADEGNLRAVLANLEIYNDRLHLLGARERDQFTLMQARIKSRLVPAPIAVLVEAAQQLIGRYGPSLDLGRARTQQREAEFAEISAQRLVARDQRTAEIQGKIQEQERRQQAARQEWQGKT